MGKRSDFEKRPQDSYLTIDPRAVKRLVQFVAPITFAEPCCGDGHLIQSLVAAGFVCAAASDIKLGQDARNVICQHPIITNPPWTREILHPLILHWLGTVPFCWLLFDADWAFTKQAKPLVPYCSDVLAVGRLKWIENSKFQSKDSCAWYRFAIDTNHITRFHGWNR